MLLRRHIIQLVQNQVRLRVQVLHMDNILPQRHGRRLVLLLLVEVNELPKISIRYLNLEIEVTAQQTLNPNPPYHPPLQPQRRVLRAQNEPVLQERERKTFQIP